MKARHIFFILVSFLIFGCAKKPAQFSEQQLERGEGFVSQIGGTSLGRLDSIVIEFSNEIPSNANVAQAISLVPSQKGEWSVSGKRATFIPSKPYRAEQEITLIADCAKLFALSEDAIYVHKYFTQNAEVKVQFDSFVISDDKNEFTLDGTFSTDIPVSKKQLQKSLKAKFGAFRKLKISWAGSDAKNPLVSNFKIGGITSKKNFKTLKISWNGISLGAKNGRSELRGQKKFRIPAKNDFMIFDVNKTQKNKIILSFSKLLDPSQDIKAFIKTVSKNNDAFSVNVRKNVLTIYNENDFENISQVEIQSGIRSSDGALLALGETVSTKNEAWNLPSVRFVESNSNAVIIPTSQKNILAVQTVNLSGLLIQAFLIHDWNITNFLQSNGLNGKESLYRVGEPVWEKNVPLEWKDEMKNRTVTSGIDISELTKKYPDGMFQIRVSFRKQNAKYVCTVNHADFSDLPMPEDTIGNYKRRGESSYWDNVENMDYEKRSTYWRYDDDPCHPAFYMSNYNGASLIERNVLISDIGLLAKKDVDGNLYVTAADLKTASPIASAEITLVNYVGRNLATEKTDSNGRAIFKNPDAEVFAVFAKKSNQNSFLKLSSGTELSVSHFETGGEKAKNGVKGFIYGERGVWRPGDTLYLTFVLQDLQGTIPKDFPVTFELLEPSGRLLESRIIKENVDGFYPIQTSTNENAPTGFYLARVKVGGSEWTRPLKIETVVPNKLSVKLESESEILKAGENTFTLKGEWLHGAKTPNYKADVSVSFSNASNNYERYPEYSFTNPRATFDTSHDTIWEGNLDANSQAIFSARLSSNENLPGKLRANYTSRIFEPSGAFSAETKSFIFSPFERYCGIKTPKGDAARGMLLTDQAQRADVVLLDAEGKPIESAELDYAIYKLEWKWWWEKDALTNATYVSYESSSLVNNGKVEIIDGKGSFDFRVDYPSWGRYLVLVSDGAEHSAGKIVYIDWPNWAGRAQENGADGAAMLTLLTDKKNYNVGENAQINFSSGSGARALVTIEKSGKILKQEWIDTKNETTSYRLPLTQEMSPNVYAHITLLQPHAQSANSLPIRLYGVVPIKVENPATLLEPVITTAESFEPHKNCSISVSEKRGREMTYTLAVVDDGLLGLTNFHAVNLRDEFYKKEASMISNYDLYKYVMNAYSGKLETLLAIGGGDADSINKTTLDANRFTPVVKFFGPFTLKAGEKKATEFEMPGYIGSVRAIVIAGKDGAYGSAEKSVKVKTDLIAQPSLPRTLGLDETIQVPVTIFNGTQRNQETVVTLKITGAETIGTNSKTVTIPASDNAVVTFEVKTNSQGTANFDFTAKTSGAQTTASVPVVIESRGIPITTRQNFIVKPGKIFDAEINSTAQIGTIQNMLELSTLPQMNMNERLASLIKYPHGCIEQITSGAFPQLYLSEFMKLTSKQIEETKENVKSVLKRHKNYRTSSGGLAYWPGGNSPSEWGTCYATHFELEAKKTGYDVDENFLNELLDYIAQNATSWNVYSSDKYENGTEVQAYRLFVLALAGRADAASMNRLSDGVAGTQNTSARIMLACAYSLAGQKSAALRLLNNIEFAQNKFRQTGGSLNSSVREQAMNLFVCVVTENDKADKIASEVAKTLSGDEWLSTQEIAWSLISLLPFYKNYGSEKLSYKIVSQEKTISGATEGALAVEELPTSQTQIQSAKIENTCKKTLYGTFVSQGVSIPGKENPRSDGLSLEVKYISNSGRELNPANIRTGESFKINISVKNTTRANIKNIALTMPIPTCWEITNERINADMPADIATQAFTYQDIRDDNIFTYFDLRERASANFTFAATAVYSGEYFIPAIFAEAMYDNEISAIVPGKKSSAE